MNQLQIFKEYECACDACSNMCRRPCFGTYEEIKKLIDAGFSDRLCLEWCNMPSDVDATICLITPALKGRESKTSPSYPISDEGCTFWKEGKCELHELGLKPLQGRTSIHLPDDLEERQPILKTCDDVKEFIMQGWKSPQGQEIINKWCKSHAIEDKEMKIDPFEFLSGMLERYKK